MGEQHHRRREQWRGAGRPADPPASGNVFLARISCPTAAACTAVGFRVKANGNETLLAEHWNGTDWATQRTPAPQDQPHQAGPPGR